MASSSNSLSRDGMEEQNTATNGPAPMNVYLYAGDQIVENVTTGRFYYQDSLGNTSHVTDAAGNLLERYTYSAFGIPTFYNANGAVIYNTAGISVSALGIRHLFQGQLWTQETGLNDYRNRVELPTMGVFLQPDPIGFKGDAANIYRFCNNNAVNRTDPTGLVNTNAGTTLEERMRLFYGSGDTGGGLYDLNVANSRTVIVAQLQQNQPGRASGPDEATIQKSRRILARQSKEGEDTTGAIVDGEPVPGDHIRGQQVPYRFGKPVYANSGVQGRAFRKILRMEEPVPPGRSDALSHYHTRIGFRSDGRSLAEPTDMDMRVLRTTGAMLFSNPFLKEEGAYRIYRNGVDRYETRHDLYAP
jgi:RHS repeat-associated protein